jgi:hypothetical protein
MYGVVQASTDVLLISVIVLLLFVLVFLAVAEMSLSRMTKPKAAALLDKGHKSGRSLVKLVANPERWVNSVLLTTNICQTVQATLTGIVAKQYGTLGVVVGVTLNVVIFYVLAEAMPKTYALLYRLPPAADDLTGPDQADQRDHAGQGPREGPVRLGAGVARHRRGRRPGRGDRARGTTADRVDHRVR